MVLYACRNMTVRSACDAFEDALMAGRVLARTIKVAADNAKVKTFLTILRSYLTQFDQKLQSKQPNNYRLGHYFEAAEKVENAVKAKLDEDSADAMDAFKGALKKNFESDFPPLKKILKLIDAWVDNEKLPKLGKVF